MKTWKILCLVGICSLFMMAQFPMVNSQSEDEFEDDDEDGYVEEEKDEPVIMKERVNI